MEEEEKPEPDAQHITQTTFTIIRQPSDMLDVEINENANLEDYKLNEQLKEEEHVGEEEPPKINIEEMLADIPVRTRNFDDDNESENFMDLINVQEETVNEEEIAPEVYEVDVESLTQLDRKTYYFEIYNDCMQTAEIRLRNELLHLKMVDYFKKRNMYFMFREVPNNMVQSLKRKYRDTLFKMDDVRKILADQKKNIIDELQYLLEKKTTVFKEVIKVFSSSQARLRDIGIGLIFTKSGHVLSDKNVEWLLRRKEYVTNELKMLRMIFIKLRNRVNEIEKLIRDIEKICGEDLTLSRYLELKRINRSRSEKIESIDTDLSKLRTGIKLTIQTLAHFAEKNDGLGLEIQHAKLLMRALQLYTDSHREITSKLKKSRDYYRREYHNIKRQSGLLLYPTLLDDMVEASTEVDKLKNAVSKVEQESKKQSQNLRSLRKNMELLATGQFEAVCLSENEIQRAKGRQKLKQSKTKLIADKKKKLTLPKIN